MGSTPNNAGSFHEGAPIPQEVVIYGANGKPISSTNPLDVNVDVSVSVASKAGAIALTSPPTNTNAGSDTALTFSQQVNRFEVQNNTSANAYVELDATASTASTVLVPGAIWIEPIQVTAIHVYTAAAQAVNGANGLVVKGWL